MTYLVQMSGVRQLEILTTEVKCKMSEGNMEILLRKKNAKNL